MSKKTFIICDGCQKSVGGVGYSTLWAKLRRQGWVAEPENKRHFCPECAVASRGLHHDNQQKTA